MALMLTKWIGNDQVTEAKILIGNNSALRFRNNADSADISALLVNASDELVFQVAPKYAADPVADDDLARKVWVDTTFIPASEKGANSGVATLDASGQIPASQLSLSAMQFLGNYNATTNTPTLVDATGTAGDTYRVTVAGTQDFGAGNITFGIGDWVYYDGSVWFKSDNVDDVNSVNGQQGIVVLDSGDISENTNLYFTDLRAKTAAVVNSSAGSETDQAMSVAASKAYADAKIADTAYGVGWNGSTIAPTQNAVYDKIETLAAGSASSGVVNKVQLSNGVGSFNDDALILDTTTQRLTVGDGTLTTPMVIVDASAAGTAYLQFKHNSVTKSDIFSSDSSGLNFRSSGGNGFKFINDAATNVIEVTNAGAVKIDDLSGAGVRSVQVAADGTLQDAALPVATTSVGPTGALQISADGAGAFGGSANLVYDTANFEVSSLRESADFGGTIYAGYKSRTGGAVNDNDLVNVFRGYAHDGTAFQNMAEYRMLANGAQTGSNRGSTHQWRGVDNGATAIEEWMSLEDGALTLNDLSGTGVRSVTVDSTGKLIAAESSALVNEGYEVLTLIAGDITNGYIDLAQEMEANSELVFPKGGLPQVQGDDYTLSVPGVVTRVTFAGDLLSLVAGDKLIVKYTY